MIVMNHLFRTLCLMMLSLALVMGAGCSDKKKGSSGDKSSDDKKSDDKGSSSSSSGGPAAPSVPGGGGGGTSMQEDTVQFDSIPASAAEVQALVDSKAKTAVGAAAVFVIALNTFARTGDTSVLAPIVKPQLLMATGAQRLMGLHKEQPWVASSYIQGTKKDDKFAAPASGPYTLKFRINPTQINDNRGKIYVFSMGASSPRPITLLKGDNGIWTVNEMSSVLSGVGGIPRGGGGY